MAVKTTKMLAFEAEHGRPAELVIAEAINEHGSIEAAARALNMARPTLDLWTYRLGITVATTTTATPPAHAAAS